MQGVGIFFVEIGDNSKLGIDIGGNVFGFMGVDCINWGIIFLFDVVYIYLIGMGFFGDFV